MKLTRRTVCKAAVSTAVSALTGCGAGLYQGADRTITIAGGQHGGFYLQVAQLLAHEIGAVEPGLRCVPVETNGSVENVELIGSGGADVAVCQADIALAAVDGGDPFGTPQPVAGIGRMYEDYLQLVVRRDSGLFSIADIGGGTVSIGVRRSGTEITGQWLLTAAHLQVGRTFDPLDRGVRLLAARQIDALFWCGGVPTPTLKSLHDQVGIRLLPLAAVLPDMREEYRMAYQQVNIPAGGYDQAGVSTIGVANLLLCGRSLPDDVVAAITAVIVGRAARLIPPQARGTQFLDQRALINLLGVPMHPGAAVAYRQLHG
jgi:TRAP transporter TAXI family solute receptor